MLDNSTVQRISREYYDDQTYPPSIFSEEFRGPIRDRGYLRKREFIEIVRWKAARASTKAEPNEPQTVAMVTRWAFAAPDPCFAVHILTFLAGVRAPVASAILAVYDPDEYTIMDGRAWATLKTMGLEELGLSPNMRPSQARTYGPYLEACKRLANELDVSLRTLDRCLWALDGRTPQELEGQQKAGGESAEERSTSMKTLPTWAGRSRFRYTGSVEQGTTIAYGRGYQYTATMTSDHYQALLARFRGTTTEIGTSRDNPPPGSVGDWLQQNVTKTALASYVGPILLEEGYAERAGSSRITFPE